LGLIIFPSKNHKNPKLGKIILDSLMKIIDQSDSIQDATSGYFSRQISRINYLPGTQLRMR
jgi:hypothetical protein